MMDLALTNSHYLSYLRPSNSLLIPATNVRKRLSSNSRLCFRSKISVTNSTGVREEKVVIVGAGIAGLATALSLHRLGVKTLVLEEAESLRKGGTSLTLFKNGWRVLDVLGVSSGLRQIYKEIEGIQIQSNSGRLLREFRFQDYDRSQEVRGVERRALLESLADELPADTIIFDTTIKTYERTRTGEIKLALNDGTEVHTKALIGCDGVRSVVAKWMGFAEARYVGQCAYRGLAVYPEGQPFGPTVHYIYGKGIRAGYVPLTSSRLYWFVCNNSPSPGPKITNSRILKGEALGLVKNWPREILEIIENTPDESIVKTPLADRWLWPFISPKSTSGCVALAGDAWHPMTPNLGQGACCALEDSIVIAKKLAKALDMQRQAGHSSHSNKIGDFTLASSIQEAFEEYAAERWPRIFPLTIKAYTVGAVLQWENDLVCSIRDNIVVPKLVQLNSMLEHTDYDCGFLYSSSQT